MIAIFLYEISHDLKGLTSCFCTLKSHINQRAIVHNAGSVSQLGTSAPCAFRDSHPMLIHISDRRVGLPGLGYLSEILSGIPLIYLAHSSRLVSSGRGMIQLAVQSMAVRGISH